MEGCALPARELFRSRVPFCGRFDVETSAKSVQSADKEGGSACLLAKAPARESSRSSEFAAALSRLISVSAMKVESNIPRFKQRLEIR